MNNLWGWRYPSSSAFLLASAYMSCYVSVFCLSEVFIVFLLWFECPLEFICWKLDPQLTFINCIWMWDIWKLIRSYGLCPHKWIDPFVDSRINGLLTKWVSCYKSASVIKASVVLLMSPLTSWCHLLPQVSVLRLNQQKGPCQIQIWPWTTQPPELWVKHISILYQLPNLWYSVIAAEHD